MFVLYSRIVQIYAQTSEKYEVYFNIFHSECRVYSCFSSNNEQTSEKYEVYFDIFYSECRVYSCVSSNNEQTSEKLDF